MNRPFAALLTALCALPLASCHQAQPPAPPADATSHMVETMTVHLASTEHTTDLSARVTAIPTKVVHLYPPVSGRVVSLRVLPGEEVRKDQEIGTLQSSDALQARADYEKAKIEVARADLQLNRAQDLLKHEVLAQKDYDDLKAVDDSDHAELERTRQTLRNLGFRETDSSSILPLRAPISGVVLDVGTAIGELQRSLDNATAIATIADISSVWVVGDLFPRDLGSIHTGQRVQIEISGYPGESIPGVIDNISDVVDPTTLTLKVRVVIPNPKHRYKPQMYASIKVAQAARQSIMVPAAAVVREGPQAYAFVQSAPGKYDKRPITLGDQGEKNIEILSGLNDGDVVVVTGAALLRAPGGD